MSDIDGALVGGAGLDPAEFAKIVNFNPAVVGKIRSRERNKIKMKKRFEKRGMNFHSSFL